jgi:hypothetical protein
MGDAGTNERGVDVLAMLVEQRKLAPGWARPHDR